jgi:hypothetical protein
MTGALYADVRNNVTTLTAPIFITVAAGNYDSLNNFKYLNFRNIFKLKALTISMDKIEIIDIDDDEDDEEEENSEEGDEEEEEVEEEEYEKNQNEGAYEEYKESIRKKTDRELLESIALRLVSLERNVKQMQDDLVDTYNLLVEEGNSDEED